VGVKWWKGVAVAAVVAAVAVPAACVPAQPPACDGFVPKPLPEFIFGSADTDIDPGYIRTAARIGYRWVRIPVRWSHLQPTLDAPPAPLTREQVRTTPGIVDDFAAKVDWSIPDRTLSLTSELGLKVIGFVGASSAPSVGGTELDPVSLGTESYLAYQELAARAIVRRYGPDRVGAPASTTTVGVWQTENELNQAAQTALGGNRRPTGVDGFLNSPWASFDFQTDLLRSLRRGVVTEDPAAVTIVNPLIASDASDVFDQLFGRPGWQDVVRQWRTLADVIGFDSYPNTYLPAPVDGAEVGRVARRIRELACPGQQVLVVETGYPVAPVARGFTPERQVEFYTQAWAAARGAGVSGFMPFASVARLDPEPVYTDVDQRNLDTFGRAYQSGDVGTVVDLYLNQGDWVANKLPTFTGAPGPYLGVMRPDGTPLPALDVVRQIGQETEGR
jgi:hypothetical protein